jgi:hypothetical protein
VLHEIWRFISGGMMSWYETKMFIEHASIVTSDALHVIVGVLIWILIAMLLRRPLTDWLPLLLLAVLLIFNETVDLWVERWPDAAMQYGESAKDVLLTLTLPLVLMVLARTRPRLFSGPGGRRGRR